MAISNVYRTQLKIGFENGIDPDTNRIIVKRKTFNNVKPDATPDQLYAVAEALASLQQLPLFEVERSDHAEIIDV
jgi:hypothetical protein